MRSSTSRESLAGMALGPPLLARSVYQSHHALRLRGEALQASQIDGVDEKMGGDRRQQVAAPDHQPAQRQAGDGGEEGPETEGLAGAGVEESEEGGGGEEAGGGLDGAAKEELLGKAREEGEGDQLGRPHRSQEPRQMSLEVPRRREEAMGEPPDADQGEPGAGAQPEVDPPAGGSDEEGERDGSPAQADPQAAGQGQREVEDPGQAVEAARRQRRQRRWQRWRLRGARFLRRFSWRFSRTN